MLPTTWRMHRVFHVEMLRRKHEMDDTETPGRVQPEPQIPHLSEKNKEWEVQEIIDKKGSGRTLKYRIRWKGFSEADDTWEPPSHLKNIKELIDEFESKRGEKPQPTPAVAQKPAPQQQSSNSNSEPQLRRSTRIRKPVKLSGLHVQNLVLEVPKAFRSLKTSTQLRKLAMRHKCFEVSTQHLLY